MGVKQAANINTVIHASPGRGDQFTLESGSGRGQGEEANIVKYGGYFANKGNHSTQDNTHKC